MSDESKGQLQEEGAAGTAAPAAAPAKAHIEDAGPCKRRLAIEVSPEEVNEALRNGMGVLRRNAVLPGFRRGHAPIALIEKRFGGELRREVKSRLIVDNYRKVLDGNKLRPIAEPDIDFDSIEMNEGEPLKFEVTVEVWPDFEPEGYTGLKLEKASSEPSDEEVDAEVANLRMRTTKFLEVEEPAGDEDLLLCDYTITAGEGEAASAKDVGVRPADDIVGRYHVKGLKKALAGRKAGETVTVEFKVDENHFEEELRGKDATVTVNVKAVRRPEVPDATDDWARELGFESMAELKSVVSRNVSATKERTVETALRTQVYEKLLEMMKFDLPEDAVRRQQKEIVRRERLGLQLGGATEEDLARINDKLEEASLERAERDLKTFFILQRIAEKEGIQATPADVDMRIAELAARYRTTPARTHQQLEREGMIGEIYLQVREEKTVAFILSKAEISEAAPAEKAPEKRKPSKPRVKKKAAAGAGKKGKGTKAAASESTEGEGGGEDG
jgi:trigger factor